jgi:hypothetical protein
MGECRAAGEDTLTPTPLAACAAEEDTADACVGPPGRKTCHREVGEDASRPPGRKELAALAEPQRTRSRRRPWGEEDACVCLMSASGEGQELTVGDGIRGAGVGLRADGEAPAPVAGSGDRGGSNGEGHAEEMKRMKTAKRGRG